MHFTTIPTRLAATLLTLTLTLTLLACANSSEGDDAFCVVMEQVASQMEPSTGPTAPGEVEASFGEVVTLLDQAERTAP